MKGEGKIVLLELKVDVLVIGGGGAACRAAIEAADSGAHVLLVSKRPLRVAGATSYPVAEMAGYNAGNPQLRGDVEKHFVDMVEAGQGMANPQLAMIVAADAPKTVETLERWGVEYEREGSGYYLFKSCFSNTARTHVIRGHGKSIAAAMVRQIELRPQIKVLDDGTVIGLLMKDGVCCGGWGYLATGERFTVHAGAVVMATGGVSQAFQRNLNPADVTGDGYSLGFEAGADLVNMEFMQIGMGFSHPVVNIFNGYIWAGKPTVRNAQGEAFLGRYLSAGLLAEDVMCEHRRHFPFSTSDHAMYLETSIHSEIMGGNGTEHGGVVVDLTHMTDAYVNALEDDCGIHHMWPVARDYLREKGVDPLQTPLEICCFAHAINGGLNTDRDAMTTVPGLFAAGETAGGPHGADRLGGNMMVTCQVFGAIAGRQAALWSMARHGEKQGSDPLKEEKECLLRKNINVYSMENRLRAATQRHLLVNRSAAGMEEVLALVRTLEEEIAAAETGDGRRIENFGLRSQLQSVGLIAHAALRRKESRGSHHRLDYPQKDEKYNAPYVINRRQAEFRGWRL